MIPILFAPDATTFTTNGVGRLSDTISCVGHEARNGVFELEMEYPVDGVHFDEIRHSAIIVARPSARRGPQPYRIYDITKSINGRVRIRARHNSYQLSFIPVSPFTAGNLTNALTYLKQFAAEDCPFTFSADFTSESDFAIPIPASIRSYLGGREGSFLDVYGGEWEFDNYRVILHRSRGRNVGYTIRYGKNLIDLTQEESIENTYTGVYPYWKSEGDSQYLSQKVVHAPTAANFPFQRTLVKDFSQAFNAKPTQAALLQYTQNFILRNNIGIPSVSLQIDFVNLPDTEEFRELRAGSENIDLCDTVLVQFEALGITTQAKVVEIWWDVLKDRYQKIAVGSSRTSLSATIEEQIEKVDIAVTPDMMAQAVDRATGLLNEGAGGHIVMNRNTGGWPNEILAMDTDNAATATFVLRINREGIGFSSSGYGGPYHQAWLMNGTLSLGGVNNQQGRLHIIDGNGNIIGRWDNNGIYANGGYLKIGQNFEVDTNGNLTAQNGTFRGGTITIGQKFRVDSDGTLHAASGKFTGDIESGSTITGASIFGSEIGTKNGKDFYATSNGETTEVGWPGFDAWDGILHTSWIGQINNPATGSGGGGGTAGINGKNGDAGFRRLFLLDGWYEGSDGEMWDVTRTIRWIDNRLTSIENFCRVHNWDDDDDDDPGSGYDNGDDMEGNGAVN